MESTASMAFCSGKQLGKFKIIQELGHGAFGMVFKARDVQLDRVVALKVPRSGSWGTDQEKVRFLREARSAAQLRHPSIVSMHEVGESDSVHFLVSDFVDGLTLADYLTGAKITEQEAAHWLEQLADALDYAHRQGVVHRDVKPSNIMLDRNKRVFLMDFGLAKREAGEITMTTDGQVLGTPAYMSPEQARGEGHRVDGRTDIYSAGVVLYQMLTGELPFRGNARMLLHQLLHDEPRTPRTLNDRIPRDLETICLKAMAFEPARRYQRAQELRDDLRRFLNNEPIQARPVTRLERMKRWCRRNPMLASISGLAMAALVALAMVSLFFAFYEAQQSHEARRRSTRLLFERSMSLFREEDPLAGMLWLIRSLEAAPEDQDLQRVIRANVMAWGDHIGHLQNILPHTQEVAAAVFSPEGQRLISGDSEGSLHAWDIANGKRVWQASGHSKGESISSVAVSQDGQTIASASDDGTVRLWTSSGTPLGVPLVHTGYVTKVHFSPDGKHVISVSQSRSGERQTVKVWEKDSGKLLREMPHGTGIPRVVVGTAGAILASVVDEKTVRIWHYHAAPEYAVSISFNSPVLCLALSPSGASLLTGSASGKVQQWDEFGKPLASLIEHARAVQVVGFHPTHGDVLTVCAEEGAVRVFRAETGQLRFLLNHSKPVQTADYSQDGKLIITKDRNNNVSVWEVATGQKLITGIQHHHWPIRPLISPDGQLIVVNSSDKCLRVRRLPTRALARFTLQHQLPVGTVAYTPDGKNLVTTETFRDRPLECNARVWDATTGQQIGPAMHHEAPITAAAISPDGTELLTGCYDGTTQLWELASGKKRLGPMTHQGAGIHVVSFSPDGNYFFTGTFGSHNGLWETRSGRNIFYLPDVKKVYSAAFSQDSRMLMTGSMRGTENEVVFWDVPSGQCLARHAQPKEIFCVALSSHERLKRALSGGRAGTVNQWDLSTHRVIHSSIQHRGFIRALEFSPDGSKFFSGGEDQMIWLWDCASGESLGTPFIHPDRVIAARFSPNGNYVLTGCSDGGARLWDVATCLPLGPPLNSRLQVNSVAFHPNGSQICAAYDDAVVRGAFIPQADLRTVEQMRSWAQKLTGMALRSNDVIDELDVAEWKTSND